MNSHAKAVRAQNAGLFDAELVPVPVKSRKGEVLFDRDEHPRADVTLESLASLRLILGKSDPEATVTAGNASGQNDAAAACIVTTREKAEGLGLRPRGVWSTGAWRGCIPRAWASARCPPRPRRWPARA